MLNNQDFRELRWRNDVRSLAVKDQGISERARTDEGRLINGLKWSYGYVDHDQTDNHLQIVPEIHKEEEEEEEEEEKSEKVLSVVVPDEHSETGHDHHQHTIDYSDTSDNRCYLRNKPEKPRRRRIQIFSDEESEGFTGEVPSVTPQGSKRRRRDEMSNKMRTLQHLVPNCHKTDKVSVLDKTIEYMKELQLQLQVMSVMGMNPYFPPATLDFGMMNNHLLTAMAVAHGQNPANQTTSNWPLLSFTNLSFPHSSNQPLFLTTSSLAFTPQCVCGLGPF